MSTQVDLPVRFGGRTYRLILNGETGALFDSKGSPTKVTVLEPAQGRKMPRVADEGGSELSLTRGSRPCSCKGAPWNLSYQSLAAQL